MQILLNQYILFITLIINSGAEFAYYLRIAESCNVSVTPDNNCQSH